MFKTLVFQGHFYRVLVQNTSIYGHFYRVLVQNTSIYEHGRCKKILCSADISKNSVFTALWFAQNVVFFAQNVVFFTQNVVFLRKMLSF